MAASPAVIPDAAPASSGRRHLPAILACVAAALLVIARSWVYLRYEFLDFDADQAVIGLMAKHFAEGRAFALYQYAFDYVLVAERVGGGPPRPSTSARVSPSSARRNSSPTSRWPAC